MNRWAAVSLPFVAAAGLVVAFQTTAQAQVVVPARIEPVAVRTVSLAGSSGVQGAAPCAAGRSRRAEAVRLVGPAGIEMTGRMTCARDGDYTIAVTGGRGRVGGVALDSDDFSGTVTSRNGRTSGTVTVALPRTPRVVPAWRQRATLTMTVARSAWTGKVAIRQARGDESLLMSGPLSADGTYRLAAEGSIGFAGTRIALSGDYRSAGYAGRASTRKATGRTSRATWAIAGGRKAGVIRGVRVASPRISMTQAVPGVTGTATLRMPRAIAVRSSLAFVDEDDWTLTATGSPTDTWQPIEVPGLTVESAVMRGAVTSRAGRITWRQAADMSVLDEQLTVRGDFLFDGPATWRLSVDRAEGTILGAPAPVSFTSASGDIVIEPGSLAGTVMVRATGALLAGLPTGWTPSTAMSITFATSRSQGALVTRAVEYTMVNKRSRIVLSGDSVSSKAFRLTASGSVAVGATLVPFGGTFESTGYVTGGVTRTEPYYAISGSIADAPGGRIPLGRGAGLTGGSFGFSGGQKVPSTAGVTRVKGQTSTPDRVPRFATRATTSGSTTTTTTSGSTTTITGTTSVYITPTDSFTVAGTFVYTDEDNWSFTADATSGDPWNPYPGLTIQPSSFHGTATSVDAVITWGIYIDEVTWQNMSTGVNLTTGFSLSDTCPLTAHCPGDTDSLFIGFINGALDFADPVPSMTLNGAFLADTTWARFDATSSDITYNGITVSNTDLTVWRGARDDSPDNLDMPDLSADNNGFGIEFCGSFNADVPDVATVNTAGCIEWSPSGVVMAQVETGGDVDGGASSGGVTIGNTTLTGYAWTSLDSQPTVGLNDADLALSQGTNYLTATMVIPRELNLGSGNGDVESTIPAQGWFTTSGDFSLDAAIPVNMTSSGVTLDSVSVHIGRESNAFNLVLGAEGSVSMSGHHYPVTALITADQATKAVSVSVSVQGGVTQQPGGDFDLASLLPTGDFEPVNESLVDGTFDGKPDRNILNDGTFEGAAASANLVANPDFETGIQNELMVNGDFESGSAGNLLDNGDLESNDVLVNGDFETGDTSGWTTSTGFTMTELSTDNAPSTDSGYTSYTLKSTGGATTNTGLSQSMVWAPSLNATYTFTAWVKSPDSTTGRVGVYVNQTGTASGCSTQTTSTTSSIFNVTTAWTQISLPVIGLSCRTGFTITLDAVDAGDSVNLDSMAFTVDSSSVALDMPNTNRPIVLDRFDYNPAITSASDVSFSTDFGNTLRSDGYQSYWYYNSNSAGYANGDFDVSINIIHPSGSNSRDISNFAFWMNGTGSTAKGYMFRTQTSHGDGGFFQVNGASNTRLSGDANCPDVPFDVNYQVRLTAVGQRVTATVTRLDTGEVFFTHTLSTDMPVASTSFPHSGVFGQALDGAGSYEGSRWDDFTVYSTNSGQIARNDVANAHSGSRYLAMSGAAAGWSAQYSVAEAPAQGTTYSYSAWVRSRGSNVYGTLFLDTVGGTYESSGVPFTATSAWQQVTVTLKVANSGHTDIRPGFQNMGLAGVEVDVDDQVLSVAPWEASPSTTGSISQIVTSDAHSGTGALAFTDRVNGSLVYYDLPGWPAQYATYTLTAWLKSATPLSASLALYAEGGTEEYASTAVTTSATWTQVSTTLTVSGSGHTNLRARVRINSGNQYETVLIDDVSLTAAGYESDLDGSLSDVPDPTGWTNIGTTVKAVNNVSYAHAGLGLMDVTPATASKQATQYAVAASPQVGATYTATAWVQGTGCSATAGHISMGSEKESKQTDFSATGTYQLVTVTLPITIAGATSLTMEVGNDQKSPSCRLHFDDAGIQLSGLGITDPWGVYSSTASKFISTTVLADASKAHDGSNVLEVTGHGTTGYIYVNTDMTPVVGTQYTMSAWVRSPTGAAFSGNLLLYAYGGSTSSDDEVRNVNFTTSGTAWQQVFVTLPITQAGNTGLQTRFTIDTADVAVDVDGIVSRALPTWAPSEPSGSVVNEMIVEDPTSAAEGASYLHVSVAGSAGGGVVATASESILSGASYTMQAYVRSTTGVAVNGSLGLTYGPSTEGQSAAFTATSDWQLVTVPFKATKTNSVVQALVLLSGPGQLDVDSITVTPKVIVQEDPWLTLGTGATVTQAVYDDTARAHDGSYGYLKMSKTGSADGVVFHDIAASPLAGETYAGSVWVRSNSGTPMNGRFTVYANGGTAESVLVNFTATSEWQLVTATLPITKSGHTSMRAELRQFTAGVTVDVDDVNVQKTTWKPYTASGGTVKTSQRNDGASAQSGSGYMTLVNSGSSYGSVYLDTAGTYSAGTSQTAQVWVRSSSGTPVSGKLRLYPVGGTASQTAFTAGPDWALVSVTYPVTATVSGLRTEVTNATSGVLLDIDSSTLGQEPLGKPDGVTTPLPHPETGYDYLWDDAFGIPGAHLWNLTAQIQIEDGLPGLGVGATMYFDPTKASTVMTGTAWLKGDMALNISEADPCLSFDFVGGADSGIQIKGGVFTTSKFSLYFAPRGCTIDKYVVPVGAGLAFDTALGDTTIHLDLAIGLDENKLPTFYADAAVQNVKIAGTTYKTMELLIDISADAQIVSFTGDYVLPMGNFYGDFDLSVNASMLHMAGDVSLTDWKLVGGTMDIDHFDYSMSMDVPFGSGSCASFSSSTSGLMSMGSKSYDFTGLLQLDCGVLKILHFQYAYMHGGLSTDFLLDYDSKTHLLAGGVKFAFERSTSWKYFGHRYNRHPKIAIGLAFSMNVDKPASTLNLAIAGTVSVSGGSGSLACVLQAQGDDTCSIDVRINSFGGHSYSSTW